MMCAYLIIYRHSYKEMYREILNNLKITAIDTLSTPCVIVSVISSQHYLFTEYVVCVTTFQFE